MNCRITATREFLAGKDHADSAELCSPAAFELPDWSQLLSEPERPQCVQPVGELHHLCEGVLLASIRPCHRRALLGPSDLLQMHAPQDHLQDGLQAGGEDGLQEEVPVLPGLLREQRQMCPSLHQGVCPWSMCRSGPLPV